MPKYYLTGPLGDESRMVKPRICALWVLGGAFEHLNVHELWICLCVRSDAFIIPLHMPRRQGASGLAVILLGQNICRCVPC